MPVSLDRTGWIEVFTQMRRPGGFLQRFFTVKRGGQFRGRKVAIDIERYGEDVATVVEECTGPNLNDIKRFTTKEFVPPSYGEAFPMDVCELLDRMAGVDPYSAAGIAYRRQLVSLMAKGFMLVDDMIERGVELQASQILQNGTLSLTNRDGDVVYNLDFSPKATHFPTAAIPWATIATATPLDDLLALANLIRSDGKVNPDRLIFGEQALENFLKNATVLERLDNRRIEVGNVRPEFDDTGAVFYGTIQIGTYRFELWSYSDEYKDPATGLPVKYVDSDNVIMTSSRTRLDRASAQVPLPIAPDPRVADLIPPRMDSRDGNFDVTGNVYATPNGKQVFGELESRTLLIPVQIDGIGCLRTA